MLRQNLQLKMLQKLSPQQIQLMKLLQIPTAQLDQRIKEELEINPALDTGGDLEEADYNTDIKEETPLDTTDDDSNAETDDYENEEQEFLENDVDITDYYDENDDEIADYKVRDINEFADPDDENKSIPVAVTNTFHEYLDDQVGMLDLDEREQTIAYQLVGSIDDDGYIRRDLDAIVDDLAFSMNISTDVRELKNILALIQGFDPPGVGAATLEECLLLQLNRKAEHTKYIEMAKEVIKFQFDAFSKKHYDKIERFLGVGGSELKKVIEEITRLNPKPGSAFSSGISPEQFIIPDYIITNNNGDLILTLNSANAPELRISNSFKDMLHEYKNTKVKSKSQKEAVVFIKQKIEAAKWFIDAIQQRQNTMMAVMQTIMEIQYEYLITGDETTLKPMILKDIADRTGLDISTISRVANSKYVQTEFGTLLLKSFFSESLSTDSGEEVSTREVKKILSDMISTENKSDPYSDQQLTEILTQKGYNIARRTVAKYREQLNYPVARLRKEL